MSDIHIPDDLTAVLDQDNEAKQLFSKLSLSSKKEYIKWIDEAKKESTRVSRINRVINILKGLQK